MRHSPGSRTWCADSRSAAWSSASRARRTAGPRTRACCLDPAPTHAGTVIGVQGCVVNLDNEPTLKIARKLGDGALQVEAALPRLNTHLTVDGCSVWCR